MVSHTKAARGRLAFKIRRVVSGRSKGAQRSFEKALEKARVSESRIEAQDIAKLERERRIGIVKVRVQRSISRAGKGLGGGLSFAQALGFKPKPIPKAKSLPRKIRKIRKVRRRKRR